MRTFVVINRQGVNMPATTNDRIPQLVAKLKSTGDADTRLDAMVELRDAGPSASPAIDRLISLLKHNDPLTRAVAAEVCGAIGQKAHKAVNALTAMRRDRHPLAQQAAKQALKRINGHRQAETHEQDHDAELEDAQEIHAPAPSLIAGHMEFQMPLLEL